MNTKALKRLSGTQKLALAGIYCAIAVVGSTLSFPVFGSKCSPVQHLINVLCAVTLGPWWGLMVAFVSSLLRNLFGLGTLLAFPGSMCGVLLSGLLYKYSRKLPLAYLGEIVGTGIIGGLLSYPIGRYIIGIPNIGAFTFIVPFLISTGVGTLIAFIIVSAIRSRNILPAPETL